VRQPNRFPFDLWDLQVFLAVCEKGTMASAATALGITQPGVSQIIQDMERQTAVELFDRTMRPIRLTPAGAILRLGADAVLAEAHKVSMLVRRHHSGYLPTLRVGLIYSVERLLSSTLIKTLADKAAEVIVLSGITSVHAAELLARQLDLCIGVDDLITETGLDRWPLVREPYVLVTPCGVAGDDLPSLAASHPFIRYSARTIDGREIDRFLLRSGLQIPRGAEFDTPFAVTEMVSTGQGWAISTPLCLIEAGVPLDRLSLYPVPHQGLARTVTLVCRRNELGTVPGGVARAIVQTIRDRCKLAFPGQRNWILRRMLFSPPTRAIARVRTDSV
jgi:DNA-binding transcriptional LysR family regulator